MIKYSNLPLVSICVAVYNQEDYLRECLDSIINQTYTNLEIIVVDNHSTDKSVEIIQDYLEKDSRIKFYSIKGNRPPGRNCAEAYNLAYDKASGDFLGSVDSDDYIALNCVELCLKHISDHGLVYTYCRRFGNENKLNHNALHTYSKERLITYFMVFHFRLFRRELWIKVRPFSDMDYCWDYDLVLKLSEITTFILLKEELYFWRKHDKQMSHPVNYIYNEIQMNIARQAALKRRGLIR